MDIPSGRRLTGAIMLVIVPVALELVVLQGIWTIILIPPVMIAMVTLNLAIFFVLVRPRAWQDRILGMLLGGLVGGLVAGVVYVWAYQPTSTGVFDSFLTDRLDEWASSMADPASGAATALRFIGRHTFEILAVLLDLLGGALIGAGGYLDRRFRRANRRAESRPGATVGARVASSSELPLLPTRGHTDAPE